MPLYIRDERVRELAEQVAKMRGCTLTDAVRGALEEAAARKEDDLEIRRREIDEIVRHFQSLPDLRPGFTDKDLYDEEGNPIL